MAIVRLQKTAKKLETKKKVRKISNKTKKIKLVSKIPQLNYFRLHTMVCQACALTAPEFICFAELSWSWCPFLCRAVPVG